jgi:uncharacterized membrane protein
MERIEKQIDVHAPLRVVYNQWTQFEDFPKFMEGVDEVRQLNDKRLYWRAEILGQEVEWEAEIAWRSITGHPNAGAVHFSAVDSDNTRVTLILEYQPLGAAEMIADKFGVLALRIEGDLKRFRDFIEERGVSTGAWRGEIREGAAN